MHNFRAEIYKVGINAVADVPVKVTAALHEGKGYIRIKGTINGFAFSTTLVPVKGKPYRLFVNIPMLKGGNTALGDTAKFSIEPETAPVDHDYPMVPQLEKQLKSKKLMSAFEGLTPSRRKDILKYLNYLKTEEALQKNIDKVVAQLEKGMNANIP